ncbi:MAG: Gldg family protein [Chloroflexota bacterium]
MNDVRINRDLLRWIVLGVAAVALIVMVVALLATPQNRFTTVSYVALGVTILGLAGYVLLDPEDIVQMVTGRTGQYALTTWLLSLVFVAFVVALYILLRSADLPPWDLTEAQKYQPSEQTIQLLESLDQDVHVTGFYAQGAEEDAKVWLDNYRRYSNGKLTYEFIDPDANPGLAGQLGVTRTGVLVFQSGDNTAEANSASERELTGALVRVLSGEPRKAYVITGHGERSIIDGAGEGYRQADQALTNANFEVETLNLLETESVPDDADLVIIPGPTSQFAQPEVDALAAYLDGGGSLFVMSDPGTGGGSLGNGVLDVAFNADGNLFASAGADGTAKVWDTESGDEVLSLTGHNGSVINVAFSPDGNEIATSGADGTVRVWDAESGDEMAQLPGQTDAVSDLEYSPDGDLLASVGQDQVVNIWDTNNYELVSYAPILTSVPLFAADFSPDGSMLAATGARNTASGGVTSGTYVWDATNGDQLVDVSLHSALALGISFSTDGKSVYTTSVDGTLGVVDVASGEGSTSSLYPDQGIVTFDVIDADTGVFALGDASLHVHSLTEAAADDEEVLTGHEDMIQAVEVSPNGELVVTGSRDGTARIWNLDTGENTVTTRGHSANDALTNYLSSAWGITLDDDVAVDLYTASVFDQVTPVIYNYNPSSPITQPLNDSQLRMFMVLARSITIDSAMQEALSLTPLLYTSSQQGASWGETDPYGGLALDDQDIPGPLTLGVSGEDPDSGARIVVVGDADFASNDSFNQPAYGNGEFLINAANWLTESESLIDLPGPDVGNRTIDKPFSQAGLVIMSIASVCLAPLLLVVAGGAVWLARRQRR